MHRFWAFNLVLFSIYSEMASWSCSSEHWWKGKSLGHWESRNWSLIFLSTLIPCKHNPPGIEQQQDFYEVSHLQGPKVKSTLLSIYELLSAVRGRWWQVQGGRVEVLGQDTAHSYLHSKPQFRLFLVNLWCLGNKCAKLPQCHCTLEQAWYKVCPNML